MTGVKHTAGSDLNPGLLRAIEVVKKFKDEYQLKHDTRKQFDLQSMQRVVNQGFDFIIEDLEAEAGLRAPWNPEDAIGPSSSPPARAGHGSEG